MSAIFNGTSSVLSLASSLLGATPTYPVLFHALVKMDNLTANHTVLSVSDDAALAANDHLRLNVRGDVANDPVRAQAIATNVTGQADIASRSASGAWMRVMAYFAGVADRTAYCDGASGTNTNSRSPTGLSMTQLGASRYDSAYQNFLAGQLRKVAMWSGGAASDYTTATTGIIDQLWAGTSPENVSDGGATLVLYKDLLGSQDAGTGGTFSETNITYDAADTSGRILCWTSRSPDTNDHQGYTTDGTYHYTSDTAALRRRAMDASWTISESKTTDLFTGTQDHVGGLHYTTYGGVGFIFAAVDRYASFADNDQPTVTVFKDVAGLSRLSSTALTGGISGAASGVVRVGNASELGYIVVTDFADGGKLYKYSINSLDGTSGIGGITSLGTITLSENIGYPQDITYRGGYFYVSTTASSTGAAPQRIWRVTPAGAATIVAESAMPGSAEGIDANSGKLRWLIDGGSDEIVFTLPAALEQVGGGLVIPRPSRRKRQWNWSDFSKFDFWRNARPAMPRFDSSTVITTTPDRFNPDFILRVSESPSRRRRPPEQELL